MAQRNVKRARAGTLGDGDGEHAGAAAGILPEFAAKQAGLRSDGYAGRAPGHL